MFDGRVQDRSDTRGPRSLLSALMLLLSARGTDAGLLGVSHTVATRSHIDIVVWGVTDPPLPGQLPVPFHTYSELSDFGEQNGLEASYIADLHSRFAEALSRDLYEQQEADKDQREKGSGEDLTAKVLSIRGGGVGLPELPSPEKVVVDKTASAVSQLLKSKHPVIHVARVRGLQKRFPKMPKQLANAIVSERVTDRLPEKVRSQLVNMLAETVLDEATNAAAEQFIQVARMPGKVGREAQELWRKQRGRLTGSTMGEIDEPLN